MTPSGGRGARTVVGAADRRHAILARVAEDQTIHVAELARELGCSEMTIRRDIRRLERDGFIRQTYGGATAHITRSFDISFNARALQATREKRLIGMRAAGLVQDARMLFVGIGSTTEQFVHYLPAHADRTVVTPSLPIASLLGTRPVDVVTLGGSVLRDELTCVGPIAMLAGIGAGIYANPKDAIAHVRLGTPLDPDTATRALYDERFHAWRALAHSAAVRQGD